MLGTIQIQRVLRTHIINEPDQRDSEESFPVKLEDKSIRNPDIPHAFPTTRQQAKSMLAKEDRTFGIFQVHVVLI